MRQKDILFVSNVLADGGAARVVSVLANSFSDSGRNVGVLSFRSDRKEYPLAKGVQKEYGPQGAGLYSKLRRVIWLRRVITANPGATVIAFEYFVNSQTLLACMGLPNRVVVSERNDPARVGAGFPRDFIRKALYRRAYALVCQTSEAAAYFPSIARKCIILNPIKPDLPLPFKGERRRVVVTFCRLEKQKNLGLLIRSFALFIERNPGFTLEIYGDGSERDALLELVQVLSLQESVTIFPSRNDVHLVLLDRAMFVLPSDYEGLSNSMLEAMALGLPTICTDAPCGGARTVIRDGENGLLVPVRGELELAAAMHRVANDDSLAERLSNGGRLIRGELSVDAVVAEWAKLLPKIGKAGSGNV